MKQIDKKTLLALKTHINFHNEITQIINKVKEDKSEEDNLKGLIHFEKSRKESIRKIMQEVYAKYTLANVRFVSGSYVYHVCLIKERLVFKRSHILIV